MKLYKKEKKRKIKNKNIMKYVFNQNKKRWARWPPRGSIYIYIYIYIIYSFDIYSFDYALWRAEALYVYF
jgi:hypothetical protein